MHKKVLTSFSENKGNCPYVNDAFRYIFCGKSSSQQDSMNIVKSWELFATLSHQGDLDDKIM